MNRTTTSAVVILAGLAWLYGGVLSSLVQQWASDENYSHGFLIIPLALYLAWERRTQLREASVQPSIAGVVILCASLLLFATGVLGAELFLQRLSLVGVVIGIILFTWGSTHLRLLAFPIALLPLMVPLPALVFNQIAFPLQLLASRVGEATVAAAGIPVLREGNILELPGTTLAVAEACSGIRSLISLITLAIVLAYFTEKRPLTRAMVVLASIPIAVLANAARVAGTGLASHWFGTRAAEGFFHGFSGWLMFAAAFGGLLAFQWLLRRLPILPVPAWRAVPQPQEEKCSPAR